MPTFDHTPVLLQTVMDVLQPQPGDAVLDVTLGLGGHAKAFLQLIGSEGHLTGLDADADNLKIAKERLQEWSKQTTFHHVNFLQMESLNLPQFDIIFADLGLSSPHVDDPERGFSFRFDGPLDLRYDRTSGRTASQLLAESDEEELANVFRTYGELYKEARRLGVILAGKQIATTTDLRAKIEQGFGYRAKALLPQIFQALRIVVNEELHALEVFLKIAPALLKVGGRLGVLSYHSLEDRMVKHVFRELVESEKDFITGKISKHAPFELLLKKALQASDAERTENPRARSVKFRALRRVS
jgi:16S rRNA (cytosine1402-N4)-methyltransferase